MHRDIDRVRMKETLRTVVISLLPLAIGEPLSTTTEAYYLT
jgi:hypothetical protein